MTKIRLLVLNQLSLCAEPQPNVQHLSVKLQKKCDPELSVEEIRGVRMLLVHDMMVMNSNKIKETFNTFQVQMLPK